MLCRRSVTRDVVAHVFPKHLRGYSTFRATLLDELLSKCPFDPNPESRVLSIHAPSISIGYTKVYPFAPSPRAPRHARGIER